jgi:hypothetical protein
MKTDTKNGQGDSALDKFLVTYCAHPSYDPKEQQCTLSKSSAYTDSQIAALFVMRHGGSVLSIERIPCAKTIC